jgi:hypothetical protein
VGSAQHFATVGDQFRVHHHALEGGAIGGHDRRGRLALQNRRLLAGEWQLRGAGGL